MVIMMIKGLRHRGYSIKQTSTNKHYMIFDKNGNMVLHCACRKMLSTDELRNAIDNYIDKFESNDKLIEKLTSDINA